MDGFDAFMKSTGLGGSTTYGRDESPVIESAYDKYEYFKEAKDEILRLSKTDKKGFKQITDGEKRAVFGFAAVGKQLENAVENRNDAIANKSQKHIEHYQKIIDKLLENINQNSSALKVDINKDWRKMKIDPNYKWIPIKKD